MDHHPPLFFPSSRNLDSFFAHAQFRQVETGEQTTFPPRPDLPSCQDEALRPCGRLDLRGLLLFIKMLDPELESFYGAVTADITANTAALARWDKQVNFAQFS